MKPFLKNALGSVTQAFSLNAGSEVFRGPSCPERCVPGAATV